MHALVFAIALAGCAGSVPPPSAPNPMLGIPIEFALPTDLGQLGTIPAGDGLGTVVYFFAPACAPCRAKVPALWAKRTELRSAGAKLVLVAVLGDAETTDDARCALESWGVSEAGFLVDTGDTTKREAGVTLLPATLVLDARGVVQWSAPDNARSVDVLNAVRAAR